MKEVRSFVALLVAVNRVPRVCKPSGAADYHWSLIRWVLTLLPGTFALMAILIVCGYNPSDVRHCNGNSDTRIFLPSGCVPLFALPLDDRTAKRC